MDWSKGYTASYYMARVDPATWRSTERIKIEGGTINRQDSALMESADFTCSDYPGGVEQWVRVYMDVRQGGASAHTALFTGLATSPEQVINGTHKGHTIACYSVLKPAEDVLLPRGWYALAGRNGANLVKSLLIGPAPVSIDGVSPALADTIIAEDGETNLSMVGKILLALDWRLRISGDGSITICPKPTGPAARFGMTESWVELEVTRTEDYFTCPNTFRAVVGNQSAVAVDNNPDSILSTVTRGREVWAEEINPAMADNEGLMAYAERRLKDLQQVASTASYIRRYNPDVLVGDYIDLSYPEQGLSGLYRVTSQSVTLGHNAATSEEVIKL